jgi:D-3-phosphoglycerate dehydrogenase / 2-oxoglutarate reductase
VVDTAALVHALQSKQVLGCGLDVLEYEQVSFEHLQNNPNLTYLQEATNVILTPHIGGWSHESNVKMAQSLVRQIKELALF